MRPTRLSPGCATVTGGLRSRIVDRNIHFSHYGHTGRCVREQGGTRHATPKPHHGIRATPPIPPRAQRGRRAGRLKMNRFKLPLEPKRFSRRPRNSAVWHCRGLHACGVTRLKNRLKSLARTVITPARGGAVKSLRSSTAIRTPARTLVRVIPAVATVLPPALAGSPSVGGARQVTMPPASAPQVALSRLTRILLLVAVALCLGAPVAGAVPAKKLDSNLAALWTTVLQTPDAQNPFGSGGPESGCFTLGGTLAPFAPKGVASCPPVKPGTKIFVTAASLECSTFEGNGTTDTELRTCARLGDAQTAPSVTVDGKPVLVTEAETPLLNISLPAGNLFGLPAGTQGLSVAHGWVTLLHPLTPGTHKIVIARSRRPSRPRSSFSPALSLNVWGASDPSCHCFSTRFGIDRSRTCCGSAELPSVA